MQQIQSAPARFTLVVALVGAAFAVGRRPRPPLDRPAPNVWLVGALAFGGLNLVYIIEVVLALLGVASSFERDWPGVTLNVVLLAVLAIVIARWSERAGWGAGHRLALAGSALLTRVWLAFLVEPLGDVALYDKLIHNAVFALGALVLLGIAARTVNRERGTLWVNRELRTGTRRVN